MRCWGGSKHKDGGNWVRLTKMGRIMKIRSGWLGWWERWRLSGDVEDGEGVEDIEDGENWMRKWCKCWVWGG